MQDMKQVARTKGISVSELIRRVMDVYLEKVKNESVSGIQSRDGPK